MKQLAIIRFWYEGNAFSPIEADKDAFQKREWLSGNQARDFYSATNVETAAVENFVTENSDIEAHYIFCAAAYPAGPMVEGLFTEILEKINQGLSGKNWDGVYLSLHGSAVSQDEARPETALIKTVRDIVGSVPIAVSLDLHAGISPEVGQLADIIVGYKTYPHIDMLETGAKALSLLGKFMTKEISPRTIVVPVGFAPTSFNMKTDQGPMKELFDQAQALEREHGFYDVSVFGGFVYGDTPDTGASITICADINHSESLREAVGLASVFKSKAPDFYTNLPTADQVLSSLKEDIREGPFQTPVCIIEPSDNIFSGGGADTTGLLKSVLEAGIDEPSLFAFFWDPEIAQKAHEIGIGGTLDCQIGGRLSTKFGSPIEISAEVEKLTDGKFINLGPMEKNLPVDLGKTAILKKDNLQIIVTSQIVPVNDRAYFTLHGLDLNDFSVVYVKAKNHFKAAFGDAFHRIIEVETPGPAASNLKSFSFKNVSDQMLYLENKIFPATSDHAKAIAGLHTASWRDVYRDILPQSYLRDQIKQERLGYWNNKLSGGCGDEIVLCIESEGTITGFVWVSRTGEPGYDAVIESLHIDPDQKGKGLGTLLLKEAIQRLIISGSKSVCLRVFDDNKPAIRFYEKLGGVQDQKGIDTFAGANAPDTRMGWRNLETLLFALYNGNTK